jgi:sugar O-acyltransferase (sialic acid O-acetyltransferase NeuD family)
MDVDAFAVFGASGFGREVMPLLAEQLRAKGSESEPVFVDDYATGSLNGKSVKRYPDWLANSHGERFISVAIADSALRRALVQRCEADGVNFLDIRASNVVQLDAVELGRGVILCPFVTLTSNIRIGRHFHCNIYSYVAHDCIIGDFVTFAPGVKCNGNVVIEDDVYIGTGAVIKQGRPGNPIVIGQGSVVGMGAVVTRSVAAGTTVVGNPAKPLVR